jgi:hypothetical protein
MLGAEQKRGKRMIGKDYFQRQATTLRKMVRIAKNPSIADRLNLMADDFDTRSTIEMRESGRDVDPVSRAANREDGRG